MMDTETRKEIKEIWQMIAEILKKIKQLETGEQDK